MVSRAIKHLVEALLRPRRDRPRAYRVAPWLLVGPALDAGGFLELQEQGVTHILDLRAEETSTADVVPEGMLGRRIPVVDRTAPSFEQFEEISRWAAPARRGEGAVYVHCEGGIGRAPTVSIALLMTAGFDLREGIRLMLAARPGAAPTEQQLEWLEQLARRSVGSDNDGASSDSGVPNRWS